MNAINEVTEILDLLYKHGWDERNGGNLSYILTEREVLEICNPHNIIKEFFYDDIVCITTKKEVKEKITISLKKGCFKKGEEITKDLYIDEVLKTKRVSAF